MGEITDREVINIMIDGGEQLCDYAIEQWISDRYGTDNATRQQYVARWREIRQRIRVIAKQLQQATPQALRQSHTQGD